MNEQAASGYRLAFRAAPQALLAVDGTGAVRLASAEAERLLRRSGPDLIGRPLDQALAGDPIGPLRAAAPRAARSTVPGVPAACAPVACRTATPSLAGPALTTAAVRLPDGRQVPV